jgi:hypothetical protein
MKKHTLVLAGFSFVFATGIAHAVAPRPPETYAIGYVPSKAVAANTKCEDQTARPIPAGGCNSGVTYCDYPDSSCSSGSGAPNGSIFSSGPISFSTHIRCDSDGDTCLPTTACLKKGLSASTALLISNNNFIEVKKQAAGAMK